MGERRTRGSRRRSAHRARVLVGVLFGAFVALLAVTGCGLQIPSDPRGTLESVQGGVLRAGASIDGELVREDAGVLSGSAVDLVEGFAGQQSARVEWTIGSEEALVTGLEDGSLDLVAGAMTDQTPWTERAAVTRGYPGIEGAKGRALVMLVPLGENRMLSALERYLDEEAGG